MRLGRIGKRSHSENPGRIRAKATGLRPAKCYARECREAQGELSNEESAVEFRHWELNGELGKGGARLTPSVEANLLSWLGCELIYLPVRDSAARAGCTNPTRKRGTSVSLTYQHLSRMT